MVFLMYFSNFSILAIFRHDIMQNKTALIPNRVIKKMTLFGISAVALLSLGGKFTEIMPPVWTSNDAFWSVN